MSDRMVTLQLDPATANLASVRQRFGLTVDDADSNFGVVCVSPEQNLYAVLVSAAAAERIEGAAGVSGSFSNPRIETFGPPR